VVNQKRKVVGEGIGYSKWSNWYQNKADEKIKALIPETR